MLKDPLFRRTGQLLLIVGFLHFLGVVLHLYWSTDWYDIMMHFLGGMWAGLFCLLVYRSGWTPLSSLSSFRAAFLGVFVISIAWEIFEYVTGLTFAAEGYVFDTILDLVMDMLGAVAAWVYVQNYLKKYE